MATAPAPAPAVASAADELRLLLRTPPPTSPQQHGRAHEQNPAAVAHAALQALRDSGDPTFLFLRAALELVPSCCRRRSPTTAPTTPPPPGGGGDEEELLFHCVTGLRHVLLRGWDLDYRPEFRACVRDYALAVGLGLANGAAAPGGLSLRRTASMACLGLAAGAWKRGWDEQPDGKASEAGGVGVNNAEAQNHLVGMMTNNPTHSVHRVRDPPELFRMMEALLSKPLSGIGSGADIDPAEARVASSAAAFLSAVLGEFSGTGRGGFGGYRQPLEFHARVRSSFEAEGGALDDVLRTAMAALGGTVRVWTEGGGAGVGVGVVVAASNSEAVMELSSSVVALTCDVLGWEFSSPGRGAWEISSSARSASFAGGGLIRPPERWREALIRPDFLGAVFAVYGTVRGPPRARALAHGVRQLLLLLSSVAGTVFADASQRLAYASFLVDGCLAALSRLHDENRRRDSAWAADGDSGEEEEGETVGGETVDLCSMISRLVANFRLRGLSRLQSFPTLLGAVGAVGADLLGRNAAECERARGDPDLFADANGWRDEALGQLLEAGVLMADDPWLLGGPPGEEGAVREASEALARSLAPLYRSYVTTRTGMARLEEAFLTAQARDLDEVREEISSAAADDEMTLASSLGRLDVPASVVCLNSLLGLCLPRLQAMWATQGGMTPEAAALLEETRLLVVCACHALTDECEGETPSVPDAVVRACSPCPSHGAAAAGAASSAAAAATDAVTALVRSLMSLAEFQASRAAADPSDVRLSPLLARTLLWFFRRWAPAYVLPPSGGGGGAPAGGGSGVLAAWASAEESSRALTFCCALCLHHQCRWPQEGQVQEEAAALLHSLARRGTSVRGALVRSPPFGRIAALHSAAAGLRHGASESEVAAAAAAAASAAAAPTADEVRGYARLPYGDRARILTALLVGSSEPGDAAAAAVSGGCLGAVRGPFEALVRALGTKQIPADDVNAREMACLCVDLYGGVARASEMAEPDRIPQFMTPSLQHLSGLMAYYARDLVICERLLRFFRDYAEQFVAMLTRDQCLALFQASADLLKSYSAHHCASRVVARPASSLEADLEEEQSYGDVLCAIQLLIHLGTKDFIDVCTADDGGGGGVDSAQVTDVIFFGLQQILPLMTQGLLQFPTLCLQYFSLVGFMMDTYPDKVCELPYDLFRALLDSLLFGMSHADAFVSKSSLQGIGGLAREHLKSGSLSNHLAGHGDIFDVCSRRLLQEVVFQPVVWDRLEPAGMALLPLAAADVAKFAAVVASIAPQFGPEDKQGRVLEAFQRLMQPEVLSKVASGGYEGRMNRLKFKRDFEMFVRDVHSFLIIQ